MRSPTLKVYDLSTENPVDRLKRHSHRLLPHIDLKCYSDLLIANVCNARDFATKITHMTTTTKLGWKAIDGQLMSSLSLLP